MGEGVELGGGGGGVEGGDGGVDGEGGWRGGWRGSVKFTRSCKLVCCGEGALIERGCNN